MGLDENGGVINYDVIELKDLTELSYFDIDDELRNAMIFHILY